MNILNEFILNNDTKILQIEDMTDELNLLVKKQFDQRFNFYNWRETLSEIEKNKIKKLKDQVKNRTKINLLIYHKNELAGWSYGYQGQVEPTEFYMANSFIFPQYRKMKFYSQLLNKIIEIASSLGHQKVVSRHHLHNNTILIAKLKHGFVITGFELSETLGQLVNLTYYINVKLQEAYINRILNTQ